MPKLVIIGDEDSISRLKRIIDGIMRHGAPGHTFDVSATDSNSIETKLGQWDGDGNNRIDSIKIVESTTTADLNIVPGADFGPGKSDVDRTRDPLLKKRKKQLPKELIKQLIGENSMITVTYSSDKRSSLGLQQSLVTTQNETGSYMWTISPIAGDNGNYSFTVTSTQEDQYLSDENVSAGLVAGVDYDIVVTSQYSESEIVAESMIEAISRGMSPSVVSSAYLRKTVEAETPDSQDKEPAAVDKIQTNLMSMVSMTKGLNLPDDKAKEVNDLLDKAKSMMSGKAEGKKNQG